MALHRCLSQPTYQIVQFQVALQWALIIWCQTLVQNYAELCRIIELNEIQKYIHKSQAQ